jgi:glycosyltransferase involved in cell wall biosynthesis
MLQPLVSIIIPYSIDRGYLDIAIESVKKQTYSNIELLIQNDNVNVSTNINNGIKRAKGEYIKYLCEDDYLTPNSITDSVKAMQGFDFIHGVANNIHGAFTQVQKPRINHPSINDMLFNNVIHGGTLMYRKDVFDKVGYFDESLTCAEEYELNLRCLDFGLKLGYTDNILYNYRRHDAQKSLGKGINQGERALKIQSIKDKYKRLPIIVGIATFKGREELLKRTIESLDGQVDKIIIYDNELNTDLTDNGKFYGLTLQKKACYYFSCDDDIIYPSNYIQHTIQAIEKYNCIVTYHGRKLKGKGLEYYHGHDAYSAFKNVSQDMQIDIAGTGVTAFKTSYFNPIDLINSQYKKMSDVIFSLEAKKQNKKILMLTHGQEWIKEQRTKINIHTEQIKNSQTQTKLCDEILRLK